MKKRILSVLLIAMSLVSGCSFASGSSDAGNKVAKKKIVVGTSSVSVDLAQSGVEELKKMGYEVDVKVFDDYFLPNQALVEGSVDVNLYQHEPFLKMYNDEKKTDIKMLSPKLWNYWAGIYSTKADKIESLPKGGKVGLAVDASNLDLDLKRLESIGLIKLTTEKKEQYDIADIKENPNGYEFVQADHQKYLNMDDYTMIIGTSNTMAAAGVDPTKHLLKSFEDDSLALGMCVTSKNENEQWVKDVMSAYTSEEAKKAVPESTGFKAKF